MHPTGLRASILAHAHSRMPGEPISARELLHLGSRAAVDQALSRLVREGVLTRVSRGLFLPVTSTRFGRRLPSPEQVVSGWARRSGTQVAPHAAASANRRGLTSQVPIRSVYLTSGVSRQLHLGGQTIELRHAPAWQLQSGPAGEVARILAWSGPELADDALTALERSLTPAQRVEVLAARGTMPTWIAQAVSRWARD